MNFKELSRLICSALLAIISFMATASAEEIALTLVELQQADKLRIKIWIKPQENIIAGQQIDLQIEIATDSWFRGGTRIAPVEIEDAIVLQRETFAVNSTRFEDNKNWTVQLWTLVIYPQRSGIFEIPAISLKLSVADENNQPIIGGIDTELFSFSATIPEQMLDKSDWIATSRFHVDDSFNKSLDGLKPGDTVTRTISMSADNLPAMMLPGVNVDTTAGIATYPRPPRLEDKVNRGEYLAERSQEITYVFERQGEYQFPAQIYYWWNLQSQLMETIELKAYAFNIGGITTIDNSNTPTPLLTDQSMLGELIPLLKYTAMALLIAGIAGIAWRVAHKFRKGSANAEASQPSQPSDATLRKRLNKAVGQNDFETAIGILYLWLDNYGGEGFKGSIREQLTEINRADLSLAFGKIMRSIYKPEQSDCVDLKLFSTQFINELKRMDKLPVLTHLRAELKLN